MGPGDRIELVSGAHLGGGVAVGRETFVVSVQSGHPVTVAHLISVEPRGREVLVRDCGRGEDEPGGSCGLSGRGETCHYRAFRVRDGLRAAARRSDRPRSPPSPAYGPRVACHGR